MINVKIAARLHDEARVVSADFELPLSSGDDYKKLLDAMVSGMEKTNAWAKENDVFIGHVKGFITWGEDEAVMLSTVGEDVQVKGSESVPKAPCSVKVGSANIVFGIDLHEVEERVEDFARDILAAFGEQGDYCHEHDDDCECGCHDHDHEHHHHHDHEHEHHHHHDHDHEHEHDEDCECGCHEHHHEHHDHEHH